MDSVRRSMPFAGVTAVIVTLGLLDIAVELGIVVLSLKKTLAANELIANKLIDRAVIVFGLHLIARDA